MIIGRDLIKKLGMIVNFKNEKLIWDGVIVPMWRSGYNRPNPTLNRYEIKQVIQLKANSRVTR